MIDRDITFVEVRATETLPSVREVGTFTHVSTCHPEFLHEVADPPFLAGVFYIVEQQDSGLTMRSSGPFSRQAAQLLLRGNAPASFAYIAGDAVRLHLEQAEISSLEQKLLARQTAAAFLAHLHLDALSSGCPVPLVTPSGSKVTIPPLWTHAA